MSCWATTTRPSSDPTAIPPTDICRCRAGKCAGRTCGAALKTSPRVEARRLPPANNCWNTPSRCLPGGIESVTAPCNAPASKSTSAICGPRSICNCGVVNNSPTPRRRPLAAISSPSSRRCGPSHASQASSPPTTTPSEPCAMGSCGATPVSALTARMAAVSSNACSPSVTPCANSSAMSSTISPRPVRRSFTTSRPLRSFRKPTPSLGRPARHTSTPLSAWGLNAYQRRARGTTREVQGIAWRAQTRLCYRYRYLIARGKPSAKVCTAIARELSGFIWAIACEIMGPDRKLAIA